MFAGSYMPLIITIMVSRRKKIKKILIGRVLLKQDYRVSSISPYIGRASVRDPACCRANPDFGLDYRICREHAVCVSSCRQGECRDSPRIRDLIITERRVSFE